MSTKLERAAELLRAACGDRVRRGVSMASHTTFRVGGPAALFLEVESGEDLEAIASAIRDTGLEVVVVGKGSNLLVSDRGVDGLVLRLGRSYRWAAREDEGLRVGGAMPLPALAGVALAHRLTGLEWGVAIPASFGGAVRMNAGAHGYEMADVLGTIELFDLALGTSSTVKAADAGFLYRSSGLPATAVVTSAEVRLASGDPDAIRARMDEIREWRREHQPLAEPNCGSVFKNPPSDSAARLVDEAGGKGMSVGGATVSPKHANFIVTTKGACAADVVELIRSVQELVLETFQIRLEPEVHLVGSFDRLPH